MTKKYQNFLVVGVQRSGTSALAERIALHPNILCGWEWTESWKVLRKIRAMELGFEGNFSGIPDEDRKHAQETLNESTRWVGFRRLFGASNKWVCHPRFSLKLLADRYHAHMSWLRKHPEVRIVHIVRQNDLEWIKSKYVSRSTGSFSSDSYPEKLQVTIPKRAAKARLIAKYWVDAQLQMLSTTNPYMQVSYEDFAKCQKDIVTKAMQFLECSNTEEINWNEAKLNRQSTKRGEEYIRNILEVSAAVTEAQEWRRNAGLG